MPCEKTRFYLPFQGTIIKRDKSLGLHFSVMDTD